LCSRVELTASHMPAPTRDACKLAWLQVGRMKLEVVEAVMKTNPYTVIDYFRM